MSRRDAWALARWIGVAGLYASALSGCGGSPKPQPDVQSVPALSYPWEPGERADVARELRACNAATGDTDALASALARLATSIEQARSLEEDDEPQH